MTKRSLVPRARKVSRLSWVAIILIAVLLGIGVGWSARTVFVAEADPLGERSFSTVPITQGVVESTANAPVRALWDSRDVAINGASGVVTSSAFPHAQAVSVGDELYSVDLRPVVAGEGEIPSFGSVGMGTSGQMVKQVQRFLAELDFYLGEQDGKFGRSTFNAVRSWQKAAGYPVTGEVQDGDIVWLPELPIRVFLSDELALGQRVAVGEGRIKALADQPRLELALTPTQVSLAPIGTQVQISSPRGNEWTGLVQHHNQREEETGAGTIYATLHGDDGESICGLECDEIPHDGESYLTGLIRTVPAQSGLILPTSAIISDESQTTFVLTEAGEKLSVAVVGGARGVSLVEGVSEGTLVRVPAADAGSP